MFTNAKEKRKIKRKITGRKIQLEKDAHDKRIENAVKRAKLNGEDGRAASYKIVVCKKRKAQRLKYEDKRELSQNLIDNAKNNLIFNADKYEEMSYSIEDIDYYASYDNVQNVLKRIDIRDMFEGGHGEMSCMYIEGNKAWIDVDTLNGQWRYFSKNEKENITYMMDIYDIHEIAHGISYAEAHQMLIDKFQINYKGGDWVRLHTDMYVHNNRVLQQAEKEIKKEYPALYKLIKSRLSTLVQLTAYATGVCADEKEHINGRHVFFAASQFLATMAERSGAKSSKSAMLRDLRLFALLGLINRHHVDVVPPSLRLKSMTVHQKNKNNNDISFMTLEMLDDDMLYQANEIAKELISKKIKPSAISYEVIKEAFGVDVANKVYPVAPKKPLEPADSANMWQPMCIEEEDDDYLPYQ